VASFVVCDHSLTWTTPKSFVLLQRENITGMGAVTIVP